MMVKVIPPDSWDFGEPPTSRIKMASDGLRGHDLHDFIKRAGSELAERVRKLAHLPGEDWVHNIALGDTEHYGSNRVGDGWPASACRDYHRTFVKHARAYRSHLNKDPRRSYGIIKDAWHNEPMGRVELIIAYNGTKEAADRNQGLLADKELEILGRDEQFATSMAARVAYDQCSSCHNKAASRAEYCDETTCNRGGLRRFLGKVAADGHQLHAVNPHPTWFDISFVPKGACRVSFSLGRIKEAAAEDIIKSGAELAELAGVTAPFDVLAASIPAACRQHAKLAYQLAGIETAVEAGGQPHDLSLLDPALRPHVPGLDKWAHTATARHTALTALANAGVLLTPRDFLVLVKTAGSYERAELAVNAMLPLLPGVFTRLTADEEGLSQLLEANPYNPGRGATPEASGWATKVAADCALDGPHAHRRSARAAIRLLSGPTPYRAVVKQAALDDGDASLAATAYALYQLGFLAHRGADAVPRLCELAIAQNYC